ncbi:hypothetical protein Cni_G28238 [Canna indica]|uniref:Cytochrome P450 724B1 n=1 Tax=Canna indica TaxID=4628 RepID=A0AAQ3QSY9_9LILI|nr:hypothetical protein Cni_G28238 [Canna indica]
MHMMEGGGLQLSALLLGLFILLCVLVLDHFLPLLVNLRLAPRGSFGWPLLGETLRFLSPHASFSLGSFLEDHCSRYGKVFKSHLFLTPAIVSCDQELNNFILQNEEKLFQCSYPRPIHGILGKSSMIVVVGDTHKKLRNLALSLVATTKSRACYLNDIERITLQIMSSWKDQKMILFCEEARKFTFSVIVKQVLGLSQDEPETAEILEDFLTFMKGLISFPLYIPGTSYAKAVKARARISFTVKAIIEKRKKNGEDSSKNNASNGDFLDVLLSVSNLSEDEKVSFLLDSLLGGYETTSLLISMAVYFLAQSPSALEQLKSEHQTIRANKKDEYLNSDDYKKMEFTQNVINETLRCGNIVKFVHRKALKDVRFKEYLIPSGWKVLPVFTAIHLDSTLHGDPQEFNPWRWEGHNQTTSKKFTPFGGGPRLCPGSELAKVEVAFFLHYMVLNFRWKLQGEDIPMAFPYVEFPRGLPIEIEPISSD